MGFFNDALTDGGGIKSIIKKISKPSPRPTMSSPTKSSLKKNRKKRTSAYRKGFASTIKTSPKGLYKGDKQTLGS